MAYPCQDCGRTLRGGVPGRVLACAHCGSPVVVPHHHERGDGDSIRPLGATESVKTKASQTNASQTKRAVNTSATRKPARAPSTGVPWVKVALVAIVLTAVHAFIYRAATKDARREIEAIERTHDSASLAGAKHPGGAPQPDTPTFATWREQMERFEAHEHLASKRNYVSLMRSALLASLLIQLGLIAWMLARFTRAPRSRTSRTNR